MAALEINACDWVSTVATVSRSSLWLIGVPEKDILPKTKIKVTNERIFSCSCLILEQELLVFKFLNSFSVTKLAYFHL